jgi:hypothetical protein
LWENKGNYENWPNTNKIETKNCLCEIISNL